MQRFSVIGTAHIADPRLLEALEAALDEAGPDQLILEMPDEVATLGAPGGQKPEMVHAWRWAKAHGVPTRGHEPAGPSILRDGLPPQRVSDLLQDMDGLVRDLSPRQTIDIFCRRRAPATPAEQQLSEVIGELIDPDKALIRTRAIVEAIGRLAAPQGSILVICGGNHAPHVAAAFPGCRIIPGAQFF